MSLSPFEAFLGPGPRHKARLWESVGCTSLIFDPPYVRGPPISFTEARIKASILSRTGRGDFCTKRGQAAGIRV